MVIHSFRGLFAHQQQGQDPYYSVTLRFVSTAAEEGYLRQTADAVYVSSAYFSATVLVYVLVMGTIMATTRDLRSQSPTSAVTRVQLSMYAGIVVTQILHRICMKCLAKGRKPRLQEGTTVVAMVVSTIIAVLSTRYYLTKAIGHSVSIWTADGGQVVFSDTRVLLAIDACITVSHLFLPIRWCVLVWLQVSCMFIYILVATVIGTPESDSLLFNIGALAMLVVCSSIGKRSSERADRLAFVGIARERTLRAEAQFQLDQHMAPGGHHTRKASRPAKQSETASAGPSTSPTDAVLCLDDIAITDLGTHLRQISEIGLREHWLLDCADVKLDTTTVFGEGSYGVVVAGTFQGAAVAIKKPRDIIESRLNVRHLVSLTNELRVLRRLRHPNIVAFYGACIVPGQDRQQGLGPSGEANFFMSLVLERVQGASMERFVQDTIDPPHRCTVLLGISRALRYLHGFQPAVVHGDLKPSNVLIEWLQSGPHAKLLDFGLSRILTSRPKPLGGSYGWLAPEVLKKGRPNTATDVYSYGCLVYYTATKLLPRDGMTEKEIRHSLKAGDLPELMFPSGNTFAAGVRGLVSSCTSADPGTRPAMQAVCEGLEHLAEMVGKPSPSPSRPPVGGVAGSASRASPSQPARATSVPEVGLERRSAGAMHPRPKSVERDVAHRQDVDVTVPSVEFTRWEAQILSVRDLLQRWVLPLVPSTCCPFHSSVLVLERHVKELATWPCDRQFAAVGSLQCANCFVCARHVDKGVCDVCGVAQQLKLCETVADDTLSSSPRGAAHWTVEL